MKNSDRKLLLLHAIINWNVVTGPCLAFISEVIRNRFAIIIAQVTSLPLYTCVLKTTFSIDERNFTLGLYIKLLEKIVLVCTVKKITANKSRKLSR